MSKRKKKTYEINGVMTYAHCYCFEVEASSKKEATEIAKSKIERYIDPPSGEFQEYIMDKPILQKDE